MVTSVDPGRAAAATENSLWKHVSELAASSAFLIYLAEAGSHKLTLNQLSFFMLAATADAAGRAATYSEIVTSGSGMTAGIKNSYRQLLEPSRAFPKALGWLRQEENPDDVRESFLRLTDEGRRVVRGALMAMAPMNVAPRSRKRNN